MPNPTDQYKKATTFKQIGQAVRFEIPITPDHPFHTDFSDVRGEFEERILYRALNLDPVTLRYDTEVPNDGKTLFFLAGMRGSGKTTELARIAKVLHQPKAFFCITCHIDKGLDPNSISYTEILLYQLERLVWAFMDESKGDLTVLGFHHHSQKPALTPAMVQPLFQWLQEQLGEVNQRIVAGKGVAAKMVKEGETPHPLHQQLQWIKESKSASATNAQHFRDVFISQFSALSRLFNELIHQVTEMLQDLGEAYQILFIVDGLEKVYTAQMRRQIIKEEANRIRSIQAHTIYTLPVELMPEKSWLETFSTVSVFPFVKIKDRQGELYPRAIKRFEEFIGKRVDIHLFEDSDVIRKTILLGGGSPREVLRILEYAYLVSAADAQQITHIALDSAVRKLANEAIQYTTQTELELLKKLHEANQQDRKIPFGDEWQTLLEKLVIMEYDDGSYRRANPIIEEAALYHQEVAPSALSMTLQQLKGTQPKVNIPRLDRFHFQNYFSLKDLSLDGLKDHQEIYFLGENGDGKTLLLQAIALAMRGDEKDGLLKNLSDQALEQLKLEATDAAGQSYTFDDPNQPDFPHLLAYGVQRLGYGAGQNDELGYQTLFNAKEQIFKLKDPEVWLLDLQRKQATNTGTPISLDTAIKILKDVLDKEVDIRIDNAQSKVRFVERGTDVAFDQLSDGYKSTIVWVSDLIIRLTQVQSDISNPAELQGTILVDEIGAFLHPKWQASIVGKLRETFPNLQWIFTTHSPATLLGASSDAIFYRLYKEKGETKLIEPIASITNLTANTILTSPLFGLDSAFQQNFKHVREKLNVSDDFLAGKIHAAIRDRLKDDLGATTEQELEQMIKAELDEWEAELKKA